MECATNELNGKRIKINIEREKGENGQHVKGIKNVGD